MVSGKTASAATLVLEKTEEKSMSPRILELREKIKSEEYLNGAILRIATVISSKLVEDSGELKFGE